MLDKNWTLESYVIHNEALRVAEEKFQNERDRRYKEVQIEKEKAVQIKEAADLAALQLARDIQAYKDEKANELRAQIERERRDMALKSDLAVYDAKMQAILKPILEFISGHQGGSRGIDKSMHYIILAIGILLTILSVIANFYRH